MSIICVNKSRYFFLLIPISLFLTYGHAKVTLLLDVRFVNLHTRLPSPVVLAVVQCCVRDCTSIDK